MFLNLVQWIGNLSTVKEGNAKYGPIIAAAFLFCLTIRVFSELQNYGPESAIRRFNMAIKANDRKGLEAVMVAQQIDGENFKYLLAKLMSWNAEGATMQVARMERTGNEVRAVVVFSFPSGKMTAFVWVVERRGKDWLVDTNKTATILLDTLR